MGRKIATVFFLFLVSQTTKASEIKAMAGMNLGKYLFSGEITALNRQQKTGFDFGFGWVFDLNLNFKLEVDAFFSQKGAKASITYTSEKTVSGYYKNSAINFPVLFKYRLKDKASPYIALGPEFIFVTAHHLIFPETNDDLDLIDNTNKFLLAFDALLGYEWPLGKWGIAAEIRYSRRLGNFLIDPEIKVGSESITFLLGGVYYL
jgi:hypothetical protein